METTGLEERISSLQKSLHDKASKLTVSQEKIKELVVQLKEVSLVDFIAHLSNKSSIWCILIG